MKMTQVKKHRMSSSFGEHHFRQLPEVMPVAVGLDGLNFLPPDPEVCEKKPRRKFTARYKLRILEKAEQCSKPGEVGALLRREGLYSSNLSAWRKQRDNGVLTAMSPKKRGRKALPRNPLAPEVARLERENRRLSLKLKQSELIIEAQKKISQILAMEQECERNGS